MLNSDRSTRCVFLQGEGKDHIEFIQSIMHPDKWTSQNKDVGYDNNYKKYTQQFIKRTSHGEDQFHTG